LSDEVSTREVKVPVDGPFNGPLNTLAQVGSSGEIS